MMVAVDSSWAAAAGPEPITGEVRRTHIETQLSAPGFVVIALHGLGDRALVTDAAEELSRLDLADQVMVELSGLTLIDPDAIRVLVRALEDSTGDTGAFCLLCSRLTGRLLLAKSGVADRVPIFATAGDALQAQVYRQEGYGDGWSWPTEPRPRSQPTNGHAAEIESRRVRRRAKLQTRDRVRADPQLSVVGQALPPEGVVGTGDGVAQSAPNLTRRHDGRIERNGERKETGRQ